MKVNVKELTDREIADILEQITRERGERVEAQRKNDREDLMKAIKPFQDKGWFIFVLSPSEMEDINLSNLREDIEDMLSKL